MSAPLITCVARDFSTVAIPPIPLLSNQCRTGIVRKKRTNPELFAERGRVSRPGRNKEIVGSLYRAFQLRDEMPGIQVKPTLAGGFGVKFSHGWAEGRGSSPVHRRCVAVVTVRPIVRA